MSFSLFLRGFLVAIAIFAVVTYILTQSVWTTVINTVICAVLIQVGYVIAVIWMAARTGTSETTDTQPERSDPAGLEPTASKKAPPIGSVSNSRHS